MLAFSPCWNIGKIRVKVGQKTIFTTVSNYCIKLFFIANLNTNRENANSLLEKNASIIFSSSLFVLQFHNQPNKNVNTKFRINRFLIMLITKHFLTHFQIKLSSARFMQKSQYLNFIIVFPFLILFFNKTTLKRNHQ